MTRPTSGAALLAADMHYPRSLKTYSNGPRFPLPLPMDRKLLDILVCPATRQPLSLLDPTGLDALNRAIATGTVARGDGSPQAQPLRAGLLTRDRKTVYRIDDGIPVLLTEEALATAQVPDFPAA